MQKPDIVPDKINNPMQLMAAWFVMLVLLVSILLGGAASISEPSWASGYLVISSTVLIFLVLLSVFLMLTIYRPHLQDSEKYALWLKDQNKYIKTTKKIPEPLYHTQQVEFDIEGTAEEKLAFLSKAKMCSVEVANAPKANNIVQALTRLGIQSRIYSEYDDEQEFDILANSTGIWIGSNVDPEVVLRAIAVAISYWPQLQYMHLSSDSGGPDYIDDQIFFGGAHSTVLRDGLQPWSLEEIEAIGYDISLKDFHKKIRDKYS